SNLSQMRTFVCLHALPVCMFSLLRLVRGAVSRCRPFWKKLECSSVSTLTSRATSVLAPSFLPPLYCRLLANPLTGWPHGICRSTFVPRQRRFQVSAWFTFYVKQWWRATRPRSVVKEFVFPMRLAERCGGMALVVLRICTRCLANAVHCLRKGNGAALPLCPRFMSR